MSDESMKMSGGMSQCKEPRLFDGYSTRRVGYTWLYQISNYTWLYQISNYTWLYQISNYTALIFEGLSNITRLLYS